MSFAEETKPNKEGFEENQKKKQKFENGQFITGCLVVIFLFLCYLALLGIVVIIWKIVFSL